ncbi:hypothetical protein TSUD_306400 [Trifolium subterraneum]|uniref:Uncharacterized protein n=1 Tax=Trifolium subterraneum TaxID=3900 RepID=A0A2Z6PMD6_TRISU|nr:hypothetical protein TSUD_306400 [Trifolium subterraneum]
MHPFKRLIHLAEADQSVMAETPHVVSCELCRLGIRLREDQGVSKRIILSSRDRDHMDVEVIPLDI